MAQKDILSRSIDAGREVSQRTLDAGRDVSQKTQDRIEALVNELVEALRGAGRGGP